MGSCPAARGSYPSTTPQLILDKPLDRLENDLEHYHLFHAARADLLRRMGASEAAMQSYQQALAFVTNEGERRFLERRLNNLR